MQYIDEAGSITRQQIAAVRKQRRKERAGRGWWNWHVTRRRVPGMGSPVSSYSEFLKWRRMVSWRRTL